MMKPISTTKILATTAPDDAPKVTQGDFEKAHFRVGTKDVSRADWQAAVRVRVDIRPALFRPARR
jgi:hypothetical protein